MTQERAITRPRQRQRGRPAARPGLPAVRRSAGDLVLTGVSGGLAERWNVDPAFVRAGFLVLASAGGTGLAAYALAWALSTGTDPPPERPHAPERPRPPAPTGRQAVAFCMVMLGALLLLRDAGLWFGDGVSWPLALAALGSTVVWARDDGAERRGWSHLAARLPSDPVTELTSGPVSPARLAAGGALVLVGMAALLAANRALTFTAVGSVLLAVAATGAGLGLILGPWLWRLLRQLAEERRERIRSEERAEVAAHLHDSVLQTLALIQRAESVRDVVSLARRQERELRAWLYGERRDPTSLRGAVEAAAERTEAAHRVAVDVVVVGDATLDDALRALVLAATEAMGNAARHSGADRVAVYVEVEPHQVTAYVTDDGKGFDPSAPAPGRMGISESIRGRVQRNGGRADISSVPGEGTEVALCMPRAGS